MHYRFRLLTAVVLLALCTSLLPALGPRSHAASAVSAAPRDGLLLRLARFSFAPAQGEPQLPTRLALSPAALATNRYWLVQFVGPVTAPQRTALQAQGAELLDYVPDYAFVVRMDTATKTGLDAAGLGLNYVGPVQPAYKLAPELDAPAALEPASAEPADRRVLLVLTTWSGERTADVADGVKALGGAVLAQAENGFGGTLRVALDPAQFAALAALPALAWAEPWRQAVLHNDIARGIMRAPALQQNLNLHGEGQIVAVADSGLDTGDPATLHPDFRSHLLGGFAWARPRNPDLPGDPLGDWSDADGHGTHVAGSAVGDGTQSGANPALNQYAGSQAGLAPRAQLVFQSIGDTGGNLTGIPSDLNLLFQQAYNLGARIHTNSWGSNSNGAYTGEARQADQFLWQHRDMYISYSAGNEGADRNSDGVIDPGTLGTPASAKNVTTIGASENLRLTGGLDGTGDTCGTYFSCFDGNVGPPTFRINPLRNDALSNNAQGMAAFSSRGPARDGRIKPDLVAPGTNILSTHSQQPTANDGWAPGPTQWYNYEGGTSMSTPLSAGAATLVRQWYTDRQQVTPSGALVKATLINGAADMTPGQYGSGATQELQRRPDVAQGWGRVDLVNSLQPTGPTRLLYRDEQGGLLTGQVITYTNVFTVGSDVTAPFRATLAWHDYPGSLIAAQALVNNLDLVVIAPDGTRYTGNDRYGDGTLDGDADGLNNVEGIEIATPVAGSYTVAVRAVNVPFGPQPFALVMSGPQPVANITPSATQQSAIAGRMVNYNLAIRNSTTTAQTFTIAVTGNQWTTVPSATTTGSVAPGATFNIVVNVSVPLNAAQGATDTATIRASSATSVAIATLTTRALNEQILLSPASQAKNGTPGNSQTYSLIVTNKTGRTRAFNLAITGNSWPTTLRNTSNAVITQTPTLAPDATFELRVAVNIPAGTLIGKRDRPTITATAADRPALTTTATVITTALLGWDTAAPLPLPVAEAALVSDGSKLRLLGGIGDLFAPSNQQRIFDPATGVWTDGIPMSGTAPNGVLTSHDGCVIGSKMYIPGGRYNTSQYDGTLRIYDRANELWSAGRSITTVAGTARPVRYKALCDASFGTAGAVYVVGGADRAAGMNGLATLYRYTVSSNTWIALASMTTARQTAYAALINGNIYVAGGQTSLANSSTVGTMEVYNIAANSWTPGTSLPQPLSAGGSGVINNVFYVFGGHAVGNEALGVTYAFSPTTNGWTSLPAMKTPRLLLAGTALSGTLYAAGGGVTGLPDFEQFTLGSAATLNITATFTATALAARNAVIPFTITVTPTGDYTASNASITTPLPAAFTFAGGLTASSGTPTYDAPNRRVIWLGAFTPNTPITLRFDASVNADAPLGERVIATTVVDDGEDRASSRLALSTTIRINGPTLTNAAKLVEPQTAGFGNVVTYTLNLVNTGTQAVTGRLTDTLPTGLTFNAFVNNDGGNATYNAATRTVSWNGNLPTTPEDYRFSPVTAAWQEISAVGQRITQWRGTAVGIEADDEGFATVSLPWSMPFYGERFSTIYIDANGQIGFSPFEELTGNFNLDTLIPAASYPNHRIALRYTDLNLGAVGTVGGGQVYTFWDQPNDRFIVEFKDTKTFGANGVSAGTWQAQLYRNGRIQLVYLDGGAAAGLFGPIGIENRTGSAGVDVFGPQAPANNSAFLITPPGDGSPQLAFTATLNNDAPYNSTLNNIAQFQAGEFRTNLIASLALTGPIGTIRKVVNRSSAPVGETLTYTITVRNGAANPGFVQVSDALPAGLNYVPGSATGGAVFANNTLTWEGLLDAPGYTKTVFTSAAAFEDIGSTGTPTGLGDEDNAQVTLPFPFVYYNDVYTRTAIVANGYLQMFQGAPPARFVEPFNKPLGSARPNNIIAPLWADLDPTPQSLTPTVTPTILYETRGVAPNRRFIVQWNATPIFGTTAAQTFQVQLWESDERVMFAYRSVNAANIATIGIEDASGTRAVQHSYNTASVSNNTAISFVPTSSGRNTITFQARVAEGAAVGQTLRNTALLSFAGEVRSASAETLIILTPTATATSAPTSTRTATSTAPPTATATRTATATATSASTATTAPSTTATSAPPSPTATATGAPSATTTSAPTAPPSATATTAPIPSATGTPSIPTPTTPAPSPTVPASASNRVFLPFVRR